MALCSEPRAQSPGLTANGPGPRAQGPELWALGPGAWGLGPGPVPGAWPLGPGPSPGRLQCAFIMTIMLISLRKLSPLTVFIFLEIICLLPTCLMSTMTTSKLVSLDVVNRSHNKSKSSGNIPSPLSQSSLAYAENTGTQTYILNEFSTSN